MKFRSLFTATIVSAICFLTGCGLYVVKKSTVPDPPSATATAKPDATGNHQGIPFYVKTAGCKREIAHIKPYYLVTFTTKVKVTVNGKEEEKALHSETTLVCYQDSESLSQLRKADPADVDKMWKELKTKGCKPYEEETDQAHWFLASDATSSYTYVDYANPYTLNVRRPLIGSASATTKLADDGTLSEGTAQIEDKTVSTVLSLIPTTDLIKAAAGVAKTMTLTTGESASITGYEVKVEEKAVKFSRTYRDANRHGNCECDPKLHGATAPATSNKKPQKAPVPQEDICNQDLPTIPYDLTVEDVGDAKKSADDNTIQVNGSIQLPKAKDTAKPK